MTRPLPKEEKEARQRARDDVTEASMQLARIRFKKANELLKKIHEDPSIHWTRYSFDELVLPYLPEEE